MEELGRRRAVGDPDVLLGGKLEESLDPAARVFGALALMGVRQQEGEPGGDAPLGQAGGQELVDDDLGAVDEIAELRLPHHQGVGGGHRVSIFEAQRRQLGQRAVVDFERGEGSGQSLHRAEGLTGGGVVQHQMPVTEGAPLRVLSRQPHRDPLGEQGGEGQGLGVAPVDAALGAHGGPPPFQLPLELGMDRERLRIGQQLIVQGVQGLGLDRRSRVFEHQFGRCGLRRLGLGLRGLEALLLVDQMLIGGRITLLDFLGGQHALGDQRPAVSLPNRRMRLDPFGHPRLGVAGFVALVVAVAAVADQVDQNVFAKSLSVHHSQADGGQAGFGVVGVDMDDRNVEALGQIAGMASRTSIDRVGGEADLVVGDDVHRAAGPVTAEGAKIEGLLDHALAGKGGVAVDNDRQRGRRVMVGFGRTALGLAGPGSTIDHRADKFEMARVVSQRDRDRTTRFGDEGALGAEMVLHVAGAFVLALVAGLLAFEFAEDRDIGAAQGVDQHVQAAPVRHSEDDVAGALIRRHVDDPIEHRYQQVNAFDRESLLAQIRLVEEPFECLDLNQPVEQLEFGVAVEGLPVGAGFDLLAEPDPFFVVRNVFHLVRDRTAVRGREVRKGLGQGRAADGHPEDRGRNPRHDAGCQAQRNRIERGVAEGEAA